VTGAGAELPLTRAQEALWASQRIHPQAPLYNMAFVFHIDGPVDEAAFVGAFGALVAEADALRTVIVTSDGLAGQIIVDAMADPIEIVDLTASAQPDPALTWAQQRCAVPLDIEERTYESALLRLPGGRYAWYLNQHHVVTDAWAMAILFQRMEQLYIAARTGAAPDGQPLQPYRPFVDHERELREGRDPESATNGTAIVPPAMYGTRGDGTRTGNQRITVELDASRRAALTALAATPGIRALTPDLTWFQLFATALFAFVHRTSGQSSITIGAPVHNRSTMTFRQTPGLFMEVYPLGVTVDAGDTFASLYAQVRDAATAMMRSAEPGTMQADTGRRINTVLNFIRADFGTFAGLAVRAQWLHPGHVDANHDLRLQVHDFDRTGGFTLAFDVSVDAFDADMRTAIPGHFLRVLDAMCEGWDAPIDAVDLLSESERSEVLAAISGQPAAWVPEDVVASFLQHAASSPDAVAIVDGGRSWTYSEVEQLSAAVAGRTVPGSVVGVALPRSMAAVVTFLGVLRGGGAYVPIDPRWPLDRIRFIVEDAGCARVVTESDLDLAVPTVSFADMSVPGTRAEHAPTPEDLAYVLFTSGSTGTPKGVMIERRSLANYISWAREFYGGGKALTFPLFTPLTFDLTITSVFVPLTSGGAVRVYPEPPTGADLTVLDVFADDAVDIVKLTPSHLALLGSEQRSGRRITQLILGGEDLTTASARRTSGLFAEEVSIHNEYGPTEATVGCIIHTYDPLLDTSGSVPIGRPIAHMGALVLDAGGHPVPFGVAGELWVSGVGVARGYVNREDLTTQRFRPDPRDGTVRMYATGDLARVRRDGIIEYLGRRDDQVKIKGVRVELGEVESALASHPAVTAAAARIWSQTTDQAGADLVHCARCGLASNYPGISFDAHGVCSECLAFDGYADRARVYFKPEAELARILTPSGPSRGEYDCLALLSGGKDSTYVLCRLVDMGLKVLAFTLDNGYISDQAKGNIRRVVDTLGVDHMYGTTPAMKDIFVDSLQRHSNVCQGCFKTIYTLAVQTAHDRGIPFIVTGLSRGQFFETRLTPELFTELTVTSDQIDANVLQARRAYHQVDDAAKRLLDTAVFDDEQIFDKVRFVDFYRYVDVDLDDLYAYLDQRVPWNRPTDTGRSTNCLINDVGIYYHRTTQGFHNYALPYSWDVRLGAKTREQAMDELDDEIDVAAVSRILGEIGFPEDITERESGNRLVAYYVAPGEIPVAELRSHLARTLPEQIIPSQFVRLDRLPLSENGKVIRDALPAPDTHRPDVGSAFLAARSQTERALTDIWEGVLDIEGIGIRDNYFDLGGDSITAVQIIARAHRRGIPITLHQLFAELTVEGLARVVDEQGAQVAERVAGPVGLTPIQHWFFAESRVPGHLHQVLRVTMPPFPDASALRGALDDLVAHHDALRQRFTPGAQGWLSSIDADPTSMPFEVIEVHSMAPGEVAAVEQAVGAPMDLDTPPLARAVLVTAPDGHAVLCLAAHHLIVDSVSWSHLVDDLEHLYHQRRAHREPALPGVMTSVRQWVDLLAGTAPGADPEPWVRIARTDAGAWPGPRTGPVASHRRTMSPELTERLVSGASEWRMGVDEIIVVAAARTLAEIQDSPSVRVFVEGHGRGSDSDSVDVTRTMGWLTALFPVALEVPGHLAPDRAALHLRDQIREVSSAGRDYGVLRYLHGDRAVREALALDAGAHGVVNYLGRVTAPRAGGSMQGAGVIRLARPLDAATVFGAEITAYIDDDALVLDWTGNDDALLASGVAAMAAHLTDVIEAFHAGGHAGGSAGGHAGGSGAGSVGGIGNLDDATTRKLAAALGRRGST
jgi:amino acid adenylation domain-containing protein